VENTILSIIASLLLAGVTAVFTYLATRSKIRLDLTAEYDKDLRTSRLKAYQDLWKLLEPLARYSRPGPVTYVVVKEVAEKMRIWYFEQGGIFLTKESYIPYFSLKEAMQNMIDDKHLKEDNTRELDEERLSTLLTGASLLRKSLTEDIGSRNEGFLSRRRRQR
jgi:hypothetical protein